MTAVLSVGDSLVSQVALHFHNSQDFLVLNLLEFSFGEFSIFNGFASFEDNSGTFERANVFTTEWRGKWSVVST